MQPVFVIRTESNNTYYLYGNRTWSCDEVRGEEDAQWLTTPGKVPTFYLWVPIVGASILLFWYHPVNQGWQYRVTAPVMFVEVGQDLRQDDGQYEVLH